MPYGDFRQVGNVSKFWLGIGVMSLGFLLSWRLRKVSGVWFWGVAILTRLLLLPMYPGDDVWRYLWEGYTQTLGFSPYDLAPNAAELIPYRTQWWSQINHQDVSAIYPPVTQLGFRVLATVTPSVWLFKAAFILADLLTCWLLSRRFTYQQAIVYAWNPLIIYSFAGGAHYDSWFILPLVAAWLVFDYSGKALRRRGEGEMGRGGDGEKELSFREQFGIKSALLLGISVAVKWMSLPILGFLTWRAFLEMKPSGNQSSNLLFQRERERGREGEEEKNLSVREQLVVNTKRAVVVLTLGFLPLAISAIGFCNSGECPLIPTGSVFVSHGRSAELIPYLVSLYWEPSRWANWIYLFPLGLAGIWLLWRARSFLQFAQWYFFALVTLSPIVHAWYFTWLVPFAVATGNLGVRLVSISAFVYFVLQHRAALGNYDWDLTRQERLWLWLPFVLGWLWTTGLKSKSKF
ncbi:MAG: glycosyl transferase family 2 [Symploca sp. SIO2B6]|nr:glycosyl transferase family 2 [Symploca sp. SIO2B6]